MSDTQAQEAARLATASDTLADEREMIHLCSWVDIRNLLRADAALLRSQAARIAELERERDEADRRAGAAERNAEYLRDGAVKRASWLHEAKQQWGADPNVSFDVVWAEALSARAELARMRDPLYEALVRLLGSDPDGAIANASEDELTGAANDANADPVIREQAASVLQARAAAREYEAANGITKTGGGV